MQRLVTVTGQNNRIKMLRSMWHLHHDSMQIALQTQHWGVQSGFMPTILLNLGNHDARIAGNRRARCATEAGG